MSLSEAFITIQNDWLSSCSSSSTSFWVSCELTSGEKRYGDVSVLVKGTEQIFEGSNGFRVVEYDKVKRTIDIVLNDYLERVHAPAQVYSKIHDKPVTGLDISPGGELGVSGSDYGEMKIWDTKDGSVLRELKGHVGDINVCQFFPSGQVVLSGSSDYQMKVWSVLSGACAATFKGHAGGILGVSMIDRGRNIVSCARDGTARLWDVPSQTVICQFAKQDKAINDCTVSSNPNPVIEGLPAKDSREVNTEGKLLVLAGEDGNLYGHDVRARKQVFALACASPVNCCVISESDLLFGGTEEGKVFSWELRQMSLPTVLRKTTSPILSLHVGSSPHEVWATTANGGALLWNVNETKQSLKKRSHVLSGPDCDPLYRVVVRSKDPTHVYTASRDGAIRKYLTDH